MDQVELKRILEDLANGITNVDETINRIRIEPFRNLGFAKIDTHRGIRQGMSEVIYGQGKTKEQILKIIEAMLQDKQKNILITRLDRESANYIREQYDLMYVENAKIGIVGSIPKPDGIGKILVMTGGTSDIPIAEEAALTAEVYGNEVVRIYDVGVAGVHRLMNYIEDIMEAKVIIAVAGMEGALASVIGGVADCPVIAVPTSVGYGANFGGVSALLSMLNSCASGVSVVNIDNGFGAGYQASMINHIKQFC